MQHLEIVRAHQEARSARDPQRSAGDQHRKLTSEVSDEKPRQNQRLGTSSERGRDSRAPEEQRRQDNANDRHPNPSGDGERAPKRGGWHQRALSVTMRDTWPTGTWLGVAMSRARSD